MRRPSLRILGLALLTLSLGAIALMALSCWRRLSLRGPGDRWRLTLGYADLGGGALELDILRDSSVRFMLPYEPLGPRHPLSFTWSIPPLNYNPAMVAHPPSGWGVHEWRGIAWLVDSGAMRTAALIVWPLPIPPLLLGLYLTVRHHPRPRGSCPACGYNLASLPASRPCPECGHVPSNSGPATTSRLKPPAPPEALPPTSPNRPPHPLTSPPAPRSSAAREPAPPPPAHCPPPPPPSPPPR